MLMHRCCRLPRRAWSRFHQAWHHQLCQACWCCSSPSGRVHHLSCASHEITKSFMERRPARWCFRAFRATKDGARGIWSDSKRCSSCEEFGFPGYQRCSSRVSKAIRGDQHSLSHPVTCCGFPACPRYLQPQLNKCPRPALTQQRLVQGA